jgi:hypothetical protein
MTEVLLLMLLLFAAYLFMPTTWLSKIVSKNSPQVVRTRSTKTEIVPVIPEDSTLRRHFLTQLRSEIEQSLFPRPTDATLQRHYDTMVDAELKNRLTTFIA